MEKYTTESEKVHSNNVMETIKNPSFMKNIGLIQSFQKNNADLKNSKQNPRYNFTL